MRFLRTAILFVLLAIAIVTSIHVTMAEIPKPADAPQPLAPEESVKQFQIPEGFQLELIAAEPLVREPTGICWDAQGRLFACELHGYNIDGQLDIEELNKTGELDHTVRRLHASDEIKEKAKQFMYGTVRLIVDSDGDGRMDKSHVFADHLPPCYGICPARDGVIVVGAPDITFLADRDGDGQAEVREVLYTGFPVGALERGINCPQWGLDDWIYVGRGHSGGMITGPNLPQPVDLPRTDFRIKADGSAIEPILGGTHTIGFAFTERGERFIIWTYSPGIYIAPFEWRYLARNTDFAPGRLENRLGDGRTYPASQPHPWRTRRSEDPGFANFYNKRNGIKETSPNGYFTSACSPLVYQGNALPGLDGQLLTCEPAQNMIHRCLIARDSTSVSLNRAPGEEKSEFLTSTDQWFNPVSMAHAPDGSVAIVDFYREIIEDYSAVPRYLQQQYGLKNGNDHGRIWRLTHRDAPAAPPADMTKLTPDQLAEELASPNFWRRQTARRLLTERKQTETAPQIARLIASDCKPAAVINALYTLEALGKLGPQDVLAALTSTDAGVRIHALRLSERWLDRDPKVLQAVLDLVSDHDDCVAMQLAMTLGETQNPRALHALAELARQRGNVRWMDAAILSSLSGRAGTMLELLLAEGTELGHAQGMLRTLASAIGSGRNPSEISQAFELISCVENRSIQLACLQGLRSRITTPIQISLSSSAARTLKDLSTAPDREMASQARALMRWMRLESPDERQGRIEQTLSTIANIQLPIEERLSAVSDISVENNAQVTRGLIAAVADSTPQVREAIMEAIFSRRERLTEVVAALESELLPVSVLSAVQRSALADHPDPQLRKRASDLLKAASPDNSALLASYSAALKSERNLSHGQKLFGKHCGVCHQAHGIGSAVGPNLTAENKRAEETMLQDILVPSASITAGYATYIVTTKDGHVITGLLAAETANDITIKHQEGKSHTLLRKDIDEIKSNPVSLMPDNLAQTLKPQDVANILAWLRTSPTPDDSQTSAGAE